MEKPMKSRVAAVQAVPMPETAPAPAEHDPRLTPNVEHRCKCGRSYLIAVQNGQLSVFHKNPPCDDFRMRGGKGYLDWILSEDKPVQLSRKQRRALAALERKKR